VTRATDKEVLEENYGGEYELANGAAGVRQPYTRGLSTKRIPNIPMWEGTCSFVIGKRTSSNLDFRTYTSM
jgi:hypothetical protein